MSPKSTESLSGTFKVVSAAVVWEKRFAKFTRTFSRDGEETPDSQWVPLEKKLESYRIAVRGNSKVLKGDRLSGCVSC
jgi:hypothetical protein